MPSNTQNSEVVELTTMQAASFVGVTYRQMQNYLTGPYPPPRQHNKKHRSDDLGKWLIERTQRAMRVEITKDPDKLNATHELARKNKELADKAALENQVRREELIEVGAVKTGWSMILMKVRTRLLSLPTSLAAEIASESDQANVQEILQNGVNDALTELVADWSDDDDDSD